VPQVVGMGGCAAGVVLDSTAPIGLSATPGSAASACRWGWEGWVCLGTTPPCATTEGGFLVAARAVQSTFVNSDDNEANIG